MVLDSGNLGLLKFVPQLKKRVERLSFVSCVEQDDFCPGLTGFRLESGLDPGLELSEVFFFEGKRKGEFLFSHEITTEEGF